MNQSDDEQRPPTRRFEPVDPTEPIQRDPGTAGYQQAPYDSGTGYVAAAAAGPPAKRDRSRTVLLSLLVVVALVVVVLAGFLVFRSGDDSGDGGPVAGATSETSETSEESTSPTTSETTSSPTSTRTRPTGTPGQVTYQFTGSGNLVGVRYSTASGESLVAATGTPWSVRTSVGDAGQASLAGIVVNGTVTCNILHGEDLLASSTSRGGPIACRAEVPTE